MESIFFRRVGRDVYHAPAHSSFVRRRVNRQRFVRAEGIRLRRPTAAAGATGSEQLVAGRRARRTARVPQPGRTRTATKMLAVRDHNTGQRAVHPRGGEKEVPALPQHMVGAAAKAATEVTFRTAVTASSMIGMPQKC